MRDQSLEKTPSGQSDQKKCKKAFSLKRRSVLWKVIIGQLIFTLLVGCTAESALLHYKHKVMRITEAYAQVETEMNDIIRIVGFTLLFLILAMLVFCGIVLYLQKDAEKAEKDLEKARKKAEDLQEEANKILRGE